MNGMMNLVYNRISDSVVIILITVFFVLSVITAQMASAAKDERDLKDTKKSLEKKIEKTERTLVNDKKELSTIKSTLTVATRKVNSTEEDIQGVTEQITRRKQGIADYQTQVEYQQQVLSAVLRELYQSSQAGTVAILSAVPSMQMMGTRDYMSMLQDQTMKEVEKINNIKQRLEEEKKKLGQEQIAHEELLVKQKSEARNLAVQKNVKAQEIQRKESTLGELNAKLAAVKNSLSKLLGKSISTNDIVKAAKIASKRTGVRKDFILGELVVETNLGKFTGGCTYKKTRMRERDRIAFKSIAKSLDYNYKKLKVSCAASWGGYGGAMGVAQFMPTTWQGYESRIAAATGNNPPDPWDLVDGVTAMALYLKDKGAGSKSGEFEASKRYFCGSSASPYWNTRCNTYAQDVQYWAKNYERLLK